MSGPYRETPRLDRNRRKAKPQEWVTKPKVGDKLGSFRLLKVLGEGGAGAVYQAEHTFLKRPVAIKVLHPELYLRPAMVARFFQEALAVNRARHPNIIDITDVVAGEKYPPFIVMELLQGEDLGDHIDKYAPMAVSDSVPILLQICDALSVVHSLGIVHRDMKPENIFLVDLDAECPRVKLLDFGIAKFLDNEENRRRTWSGNVLGTPAYMPLEQLHGLPVDHRADIYAVGVVAYEMLTGRLPFEIESLEDLANHRLTLEPPPPSARTVRTPPEPISPAIDRVVLRCLVDDPTKRFQTVQELSEGLRQALLETEADEEAEDGTRSSLPSIPGGVSAEDADEDDAESSLPSIPRIPTPSEAETPRPRRGRLVAAAVALMVLAPAVWLGVRWSRSEPATAQETRSADASDMAPAQGTPIRLISVPPHARIHRQDTGAFVGQTPATLTVHSGQPQKLELRVPGYHPRRITVRADGPTPLRVYFERLAAMRPVEPMTAPRRPPPRVRIRYVRVPAMRRAPPPRPDRRVAARPMVSEHGVVDPFKK